MKNVSAKLLKVIGSVNGTVAKSGYNSHNKYAYVMEKDLLEAVRNSLIKNGLLITSSVESVEREGNITTVRVKNTVVDPDSAESLEIWSVGQGADGQDKGVFKAVTGAYKYFLLKTFLLSGGDEVEADSPTDKPVAIKTVTVNSTTPNGVVPPVSKKPTFPGFAKSDKPKVEY